MTIYQTTNIQEQILEDWFPFSKNHYNKNFLNHNCIIAGGNSDINYEHSQILMFNIALNSMKNDIDVFIFDSTNQHQKLAEAGSIPYKKITKDHNIYLDPFKQLDNEDTTEKNLSIANLLSSIAKTYLDQDFTEENNEVLQEIIAKTLSQYPGTRTMEDFLEILKKETRDDLNHVIEIFTKFTRKEQLRDSQKVQKNDFTDGLVDIDPNKRMAFFEFANLYYDLKLPYAKVALIIDLIIQKYSASQDKKFMIIFPDGFRILNGLSEFLKDTTKVIQSINGSFVLCTDTGLDDFINNKNSLEFFNETYSKFYLPMSPTQINNLKSKMNMDKILIRILETLKYDLKGKETEILLTNRDIIQLSNIELVYKNK